jgi:hypothetical protein
VVRFLEGLGRTLTINAELTDDKQRVIFVDTTFTKAEYRKAWKAKGTYLPDYLKDEREDISPNAAPTAPKGKGKR